MKDLAQTTLEGNFGGCFFDSDGSRYFELNGVVFYWLRYAIFFHAQILPEVRKFDGKKIRVHAADAIHEVPDDD